jgi:two-component system, cell cycle sensor histidine kinase and response regulator CckA
MSKTKNSSLNGEEISPLTITSDRFRTDSRTAVAEEENKNAHSPRRSLARVLNEIDLHIISTSRQGIIVYDRDLTYMLWNSIMEEMTGLSSSEVIGKHHSELFPFLQEQGLDRLLDAAVEGHQTSTPEFAYYVPNTGRSGWAAASYGPLRDLDGEIVGVIASVEDVTRRILAEQALEQSEERYRNAVERATDVVYMLAIDGTIISLNQAFETVTGWSRTEWIGQSFLGLIHTDDLPKAAELLQCVLQGEQSGTFELRMLSRNGQYLVGECCATPQKENNRVVAVFGMVRDVTARKRVEEALRRSEDRFRNLAETAPDAILIIDESGHISFTNRAASRIFGRSNDEMLGADLTLLMPEYLWELHRAGFGRFNETGERPSSWHSIRLAGLGKNGAEIPLELSLAEFFQDGTRYFTGIVREISDAKVASGERSSSETHYREMVESLNDSVYALDEHGVIDYISPAIERIIGYQPSEIMGRPLAEVVYPEDAHLFAESLKQAMDGATEALEYRLISKEGDVRRIRSSARRIFSDADPVGLLGTMVDITDRKAAEARLERLSAAIEQASESVAIIDTKGKIQYVNCAFERNTSYSREELVGESFRVLRSSLQDSSAYEDLWSAIAKGERWTGRLLNRRKDGSSIEEESTVSPVRNESGEIVNFVAVNRDVTKEVELEKQLLHAQKMEAVGRLAGGVAHDFNNLLTAIIGYGQLVQNALGPNHSLRSEIKEILDAGTRAASLTGQLLAFSRRQKLVPRNIDLTETIGNLMKMLHRIIGEDIDLSFHTSPSVHQVFADSGQIEQVIMNLVVNARDAMPSGGRLIIEANNVILDEQYCRENLWAKPGEYARISVTDTGIGMDAETRRHIFEPFFTTKESGKGTGLGLAVVYGIVKQHDGLIHVYSEPGHGTTFKIYFRAQSIVTQDGSTEAQSAVRGGDETILIAEDEETLRELARSILQNLGYRVLLASNGEEAVSKYNAAEGEIDLVMLDLIMPRLGGSDAYKRMIATGKRVPVIFMTGYASGTVQTQAVGATGAVLIQKPYAVDELVRAVREMLDRNSSSFSLR